MRGSGPIYLDANVLVHAFEKRDALADLLATLLSSAESSAACLTSQLSYAEVMQKPYADNDEEMLDLVSLWLREGTDGLAVAAIDAEVLYRASVVRTLHRGLKLPDAIHVSTALGSGCRCLLTSDLRIPDPIGYTDRRLGPAQRFEELPVIRPTIETVRRLIEDGSP